MTDPADSTLTPEQTLRAVAALGGHIGDALADALAERDRLRTALRQVVGAHQPEHVELSGTCDRGFDEPGSGCCGACERTVTTTVCTCGAGLDLQPCPTLTVVADALGVRLADDADGASLAPLLAARLRTAR